MMQTSCSSLGAGNGDPALSWLGQQSSYNRSTSKMWAWSGAGTRAATRHCPREPAHRQASSITSLSRLLIPMSKLKPKYLCLCRKEKRQQASFLWQNEGGLYKVFAVLGRKYSLCFLSWISTSALTLHLALMSATSRSFIWSLLSWRRAVS